jgi:hypothetical protein
MTPQEQGQIQLPAVQKRVVGGNRLSIQLSGTGILHLNAIIRAPARLP